MLIIVINESFEIRKQELWYLNYKVKMTCKETLLLLLAALMSANNAERHEAEKCYER